MYIKKGNWGGDRRSSNGRKKGSGSKHSDYITIFNNLHFKKRQGWLPQANKEKAECPDCGNMNGEFLTQRRPTFYECEKCGRFFDIDIKLHKGL